MSKTLTKDDVFAIIDKVSYSEGHTYGQRIHQAFIDAFEDAQMLKAEDARKLVARSKRRIAEAALDYIWQNSIYPAASKGERKVIITAYGFETTTKFENLPMKAQEIYSLLLEKGYDLELKQFGRDRMYNFVGLQISW